MKHIFVTAYGSYSHSGSRWCHACQQWIDQHDVSDCQGFCEPPCHVCQAPDLTNQPRSK